MIVFVCIHYECRISFNLLILSFYIVAPHVQCREGISCDICMGLNGTCMDDDDDKCCFNKTETERKCMIRHLVKKLHTCLLNVDRESNVY